MEISQIAGLPAHALVVHVAVVLVPLSGLAFVATCWRPDWRRKYGLLIAALAVVGAAGAVLAASTGEPLADSVRQAARASGDVARLGEHPEQGDTARLVAVVFAMVAAGFYAIVRWGDRYRVPPWAVHATYGVGVVVAVLATASIVVAGHSGAALVWRDVGTYVPTH